MKRIKLPFKIGLIIIVSCLSILGIMVLIAIFNYHFTAFKGTNFSSRYTYILSDKTAMDGWQEYEDYFNKKFDRDKQFGQFRRMFIADELKQGKIRILENEKVIKGVVFQDGQRYRAKVNLETGEIIINKKPLIWHWHWYNWLGIGLEKIKQQTLEEMVNAPLPVRR